MRCRGDTLARGAMSLALNLPDGAIVVDGVSGDFEYRCAALDGDVRLRIDAGADLVVIKQLVVSDVVRRQTSRVETHASC